MKRLVVALLACFVLIAIPAASAGGDYKHKKVYLCYKGETVKVYKKYAKYFIYKGATWGKCKVQVPPIVVVPVASPQVNTVLLCMPYPVLRVADNTMGLAANVDIKATASKPWTDGTIARFYPGVGATCDNLGGTLVTPGYLNRGSDYEYPVWRR